MSTSHPFHGALRSGPTARRLDLRVDADRIVGTLDAKPVEVRLVSSGEGEITLEVGGRRVHAVVARRGNVTCVSIGGTVFEVARADAAEDAAGPARGEAHAASPMTGLVTKVHAAPGASIAKGAPLFSVEAMKMEYVVKADRDVVVGQVNAKAGDRVTLGAVVVTFVAEAP